MYQRKNTNNSQHCLKKYEAFRLFQYWDKFFEKVLCALILSFAGFVLACDNPLNDEDSAQVSGMSQAVLQSEYQINYEIQYEWSSVFIGQVTLINHSDSAIDGWTVAWTFPDVGQTIVNGWSGWNGIFSQSGTKVTVTNTSYNGYIPSGGETTFGFMGRYSSSNPVPVDITLNSQSTDDATDEDGDSTDENGTDEDSTDEDGDSTDEDGADEDGTDEDGDSTDEDGTDEDGTDEDGNSTDEDGADEDGTDEDGDSTDEDAADEDDNDTDGLCPFDDTATPDGVNWVNGDMIEFNDNGGWCWYQDERVIVDTEDNKLVIGSVASGGSRSSHVEVVIWDVETRQGTRHHLGTMAYPDDHDAPALIKTRNGGYAAMWAGHNNDCYSYYSVYDGVSWSTTGRFDWSSFGCSAWSANKITYANLWYVGDTLNSYVRSSDTRPNYLYSTDHGASWNLGGRLTSTPQVGYVAGYYKYWGDNVNRIDFLGTEAHPRDNDNSLYHGYREDLTNYNSDGQVIDNDATDDDAKDITAYTQVFRTGTTINGVRLEHAWNCDLVRYDDGTIAAIGTARVSGTGSDDPDKRMLYFRFDGISWSTTYLAKAGTKLFSSEQDYTGLGALDPDDPRVVYISTPYDPNTDEGDFYGKKEIWKGVTCDEGDSFTWEPVTANSSMDNLRPIIPKWDKTHRALLWTRGAYRTAQDYDLQIVGIIESP